jgi:glycosyltransferase involved in cell wall biosynthesis
MDRTIVVIPCYNEAQRLNLEAFCDFAARVQGVEFLFADDGSTDATPAMLQGLKRERPGAVDVLTLPKNAGKAEAVRQGVLEALRRGCTFVAFWDADLSTGLDEIEPFRNIMRDRPEIEMVFGSRVNLLGRHIQRKLSRHYLGRIFATMVAFALRLPIYDTQCGAKMFRATADLQRVFDEPFISRWIFDVEIIARFLVLRKDGQRPLVRSIIVEKPLVKWTDVEGSKLRPRHFFRVMTDFVRIYGRYLRGIGRSSAS